MGHGKYNPKITDKMNIQLCIARELLMQIMCDDEFNHEFGKRLAARLETGVHKIDEVRQNLESKTTYITSLDPDAPAVISDMVRTMRTNLYKSFTAKRDEIIERRSNDGSGNSD